MADDGRGQRSERQEEGERVNGAFDNYEHLQNRNVRRALSFEELAAVKADFIKISAARIMRTLKAAGKRPLDLAVAVCELRERRHGANGWTK